MIAGRADAQACLGLGSLTTNPTNLTVSANFTEGAKGLDGRFGFGSSIAFGGISAGFADYDHSPGTAKTVAIDGGLSYVAGAGRNVSVCPVGTLGYVRNPDVSFAGRSYGSSTTFGPAGVALGARVGTTSSLALIPFAALQAVYSRFSLDDAVGGDDTETYGELSGGLSFVLSPTVLVRPYVVIPLGLEGADPTYGIGLSFGFGRR
ncbi:MAG TPA: hypothetical protein VFV33_24365 [Gemmatimonadaceae bacterium]|nr:hypothetical protein [Gemmatimonadaceae bacterium]